MGPMRWIPAEDGTLKAMAVGSVNGKERREFVATLFPDGTEGKTVSEEGKGEMQLTQTLSHPLKQAVETTLPPVTPVEEVVLKNGVVAG